ncbi:MAG: T9SS type A sorting domain-containing protein [Bacteroidetes bacterium]|nr:T9SS type A sorting domain-containing protein [Bacteroidota bacterium]
MRKTYPATGASSIRIKVWQGDSVPETEIASKQVPLNQLYPNTFCLIDFDSAISLSGDFFVGFELDYNPALQDTFVITMHNDRGPGGLNTAYILQDGVWRTPHDYSVYYGIPQLDITTSLFLPVISCPLGIEEHKSDREHLLLVYPNPTTGMLMMETGTSPGNNYRIELYDLAGRAHFPPAVRSGNVLCTDIGTYPEGIYIARVYYGNFSYSCKVVLAK